MICGPQLLDALEREQFYPKKSILINGDTVIFRLLEKMDEENVKCFFANQVPEWEARYLRHNVRDPAVVSGWFKNIDYRISLPLLAFDKFGDRILGVATLHFMMGVHRHVAEIRIVVGKDCRKIGLGSLMLKELIRVANELKLYHLKAKIPTENQSAIKAFRQLGFEMKCVIEDYFVDEAGRVKDIAIMMKRLKIKWEDDMFLEF